MKSIFNYLENIEYAGIISTLISIGGIYLIFVTFMDKAFGIKLIGNKVFKRIYAILTLPSRMEKQLIAVNNRIVEIHDEVIYENGKQRLIDVVAELKANSENLIIGQSLLEANQMAFFDSSTTPMFMNDQNNELCYVNSAWFKLTGISSLDEIRGVGWLKLIPKEDREEILVLYKNNIQVPAAFSGRVKFLNIQTNKVTLCHCQTSLVRDSNNNIIKSIGTLEILD